MILGGTKTFKLEIADGPKTDTISKSVLVSQKILPSDYFTESGHTAIKPTIKYSYVSSNNWIINVSNYVSPLIYYSMLIYFPGTSAPTSTGTYSLQNDATTLTTGKASIHITFQNGIDFTDSFNSFSGQLFINYINNGMIHAVFNNIDSNNGTLDRLSGDITIR